MNYFKGIFFFLLSILCGALNDILAKYICGNLHPAQIAFLRFFFSFIVLVPIAIFYGKKSLITENIKVHIYRGGMLFLGMLAWIYGLNYVKISTATTMSFSIPLFTLLLGSIFLKEKVIWQRWLVAFIGFIGIFITLSPSSSDFNIMSLIFILSAFVFASLDIINKIYISRESMFNMIFYSSLVTLIFCAPLSYLYWSPICLSDIYVFLAIGISANLLLFFMLKAFALADATALAPYRYSELLITSGVGYFIFNEVISTNTIYGALIIIPSTLFIIYSEKK